MERVLIFRPARTPAAGARTALVEHGFDVIAEAATPKEAIEVARRESPDIVLIESDQPGPDGFRAGRRILAERPETTVVVLSGREDPKVAREAIKSGFTGVFVKRTSGPDLAEALRFAGNSLTVMPHRVARAIVEPDRPRRSQAERDRVERLTPREREILTLLSDGATSKEMARALVLSPNTVRTHIQNILAKLQVHSRLEAVALAVRHELHKRAP